MYQGFDLTPWQKRWLWAAYVFAYLLPIMIAGMFVRPSWLRRAFHFVAGMPFFVFYPYLKGRVRHLVVKRMMRRKLEAFYAPQAKEEE